MVCLLILCSACSCSITRSTHSDAQSLLCRKEEELHRKDEELAAMRQELLATRRKQQQQALMQFGRRLEDPMNDAAAEELGGLALGPAQSAGGAEEPTTHPHGQENR